MAFERGGVVFQLSGLRRISFGEGFIETAVADQDRRLKP